MGRRRRAGAVRRIARRHEEDRVHRRLGTTTRSVCPTTSNARCGRTTDCCTAATGSHALLQPRRQAADVSRLGRSAGHARRQPDHVQADQRSGGTARRRIRSRCSWCRAWAIARAGRAPTCSTRWRRSIGGSSPAASRSRSSPRHVTGGVVDRTRPLCAYPATAHYIGSGSTDEARNFRCQAP